MTEDILREILEEIRALNRHFGARLSVVAFCNCGHAKNMHEIKPFSDDSGHCCAEFCHCQGFVAMDIEKGIRRKGQ